jgi:hypothetical protein
MFSEFARITDAVQISAVNERHAMGRKLLTALLVGDEDKHTSMQRLLELEVAVTVVVLGEVVVDDVVIVGVVLVDDG